MIFGFCKDGKGLREVSVAVAGVNEPVLLVTLTFGRDSWNLSGPGAAAEVAAVLASTSGPYRDLPKQRGRWALHG